MNQLANALRAHNKENALVERNLAAANIADALQKSLAPLGTYNIPMLLDERRIEHGIPNGAFEHFPLYDKVYIWQLTMSERRTYSEGGSIEKPEMRLAYDRNTSPRGIIVAAGLKALDSLRSTGCDIGHIVRFKKFSPFMQEVAEINGKTLELMVIRDGDIVSSEDLATLYHKRIISIVNAAQDKGGFDFRFATTKADGEVEVTGQKVEAYYDPSV